MKGSNLKSFFMGVFVVASGLSVLAAVNVPHTFQSGTPIKANEVNANFSSLKGAIETLQLGSLALPLALEGSATAEKKVLLDITANDGGASADGIGLRVRNTGPHGFGIKGEQISNGTGVYGLSGAAGAGVRGDSATGYGVWGRITATTTPVTAAAVYGENSGNFGYGVRGEHKGSGFGVYGSSAATGVGGESTTGFGVRGITQTGRAAVYGENQANTSGSGVEGRANGSNAAGVYGINPTGPGAWGSSNSGAGGYFLSQTGRGVEATTGNSNAVIGTNNSNVHCTICGIQRGTALIFAGFNSGGSVPVFQVENDGFVRTLSGMSALGDIRTVGDVYSRGSILTSDRNAKTNFKAVDAGEVLEKIARMPISRWNYKDDRADRQHIGPMAQDFQAAFGLNGGDDKHISAVDAQGVALAAIQGLNQKLEAKNKQIAQLETTLAQLEARLSKLEQR